MSMLAEPDLSLASILDRMGAEAHALSADLQRAEAALHEVLDRLTFLPANVAADLQRLDLVRQMLDDLARLLRVCAEATPAPAALSAGILRAETRLADLAARLAGSAPVSTFPAGSDLDLF